MSQENLELARQLYDVIASGDVDRVDALVAEDMVDHEPPQPGAPPGREGFKHFIRQIKTGFPDLQCNVQDITADGDKVWARTTFVGTHRGEFMGVQPTGNRVEFQVVDIVRFQDGRCVEHWGVGEAMGLMAQIGAVPS